MNDYPDKYCIDLHNYERFPTREVKVGDIPVGALHPIRLQSMTNVSAMDIDKSVMQCQSIFDAGADFVRIATPRIIDVESLKEIKKILHKNGYTKPLIADIHFNPVIAEEAAKIVEKVRINPGNYVDKRATFKKVEFSDFEYNLELEKIHERILPLIKTCKEYGTAIRIGSNHGSLSDRILTRYGNTVEGMVESAMEFINIFVYENFFNLVISMKASDVKIMTHACRLLNARMIEQSCVFPQHLGVTEAGADIDGRLKSSVGIGAILSDGIGDTIRVSLTENPENEIIFGKKIIKNITEKRTKFQNISQYKNTYNPYITQEKYNTLKLAGNKFVVVSETTDSNPDIIYFQEYIDIKPEKKYLTNYKNWKSYINHENIFPLIKASDIDHIKALKDKFFFIEFSKFDLNKNEVLNILLNENVCPVLNFVTENPLGELRLFYKKIGEHHKIPLILKYSCTSLEYEDIMAETGIFPGSGLIDNLASGLWLKVIDKKINTSDLQLDFLQAIGIRYSKAEFVSCPGCGRTDYDLEKLTREIKKEFAHLKNLKIAIMGCVVNGPGEMADADYGCVGAAKGLVHIYKGKDPVVKNIPEENAVEYLKKIITENNDWIDK
ncbi:MAG: (E)-4-hydroxy-3-methylbut-2-enyl-diphosphate synthase [Bacteroidales bacterium]|jgi:(E)-4-hydroxy-3-methylbut-2-enyl-diphosphate synthase|nr:(E)-4-hydroxy-3-methylbut-2-enyl-diphosphate synthase [Bacteroidales bacterium]